MRLNARNYVLYLSAVVFFVMYLALSLPKTARVKIVCKKEGNKTTGATYIFNKACGRFGNLMFGFTSMISIGMLTNKIPVFGPKFNNLRNVFPKLDIPCTDLDGIHVVKSENNVGKFTPDLLDLKAANYTIRGCLQSYKYFNNTFDIIYNSSFLLVNQQLEKNALMFIRKKVLQKGSSKVVTVGVHVRRGDYLTASPVYRVALKDDILNAIKYVQGIFKNALFIVASDDIPWCKENLKGPDVVYSELEDSYADFVLLTKCDHLIMTVGSFGFWASWFVSRRGGYVLYYQYPFKGDDLSYRHDYYPGHWFSYTNKSVTLSKLLPNSILEEIP